MCQTSCRALDAFKKGFEHILQPNDNSESTLRINNSLVRQEVSFFPIESGKVSWYICGPTVYDVTHMGHARNYVTFDILRRILEQHFGYEVSYIMNVTDIDDKIILKARRNYLLRQYKEQEHSDSKIAEDVADALKRGVAKQEGKVKEQADLHAAATDQKKAELQKRVEEESKKLDTVQKNHAAVLQLLEGDVQGCGKKAIELGGDALAERLDADLGATVTDHSIYADHAKYYEDDFFADLAALGCLRPTQIERIQDNIQPICDYIRQIINNGLAYESNGSVYFDTAKFQQQGHQYGKLKPWAVGSASLAAEGEANFETTEKRSAADFALWKAAKAGEPWWDSPWGTGRPGWHIECSAIACKTLGRHIDIHSGGDDLKFPHHDNEQAQCEAYYHHEGCQQWVNYWLHSGHLAIEGLKMSKSLKNFTSIKEALQSHSAMSIRMLFCLARWDQPMNYGQGAMREARFWEATFRNCLAKCEFDRRGLENVAAKDPGPAEQALVATQATTTNAVNAALCANFNTRGALDALRDLSRAILQYRKACQTSNQPIHAATLSAAAQYIETVLARFGLAFDLSAAVEVSPVVNILQRVRGASRMAVMDKGMGEAQHRQVVESEMEVARWSLVQWYMETTDADVIARCGPVLAVLKSFTHALQTALDTPTDFKPTVLQLCDTVRDEWLPEAGVKLEDVEADSEWMLLPVADLLEERKAKLAAAAAKLRGSLEGKLQKVGKELDKYERILAMGSAQEGLKAKYSQFDPQSGDPTHDKDGKALQGKAVDKARKELAKEVKLRKPLADALDKDPKFVDNLRQQVAQLKEQLAKLGGENGSSQAN